ncbi:hypothetical protein B0H17DRAFT_266359 [Mycena rosella]|uniref:Uncharacterized protein n=1 Tax=Mycena rosella TaxID=1033263 RepID=A0AAD7CWE0_MYCRO|nr:hypothetical protein B0H17DRAFT_266359 [Mycena rosella]
MMIVNDEPVAIAEPVEAPPVEEAAVEPEPMPVIEPAAPTDDGLQFDTAAEVIGSGHIEPLREPEAANDAFVDLPAVPVVETRPDLVRGSTAISHLELTPSPEEKKEELKADGLLPSGETLGPQAALSIAEVSAADEAEDGVPAAAEEEAPVHGALSCLYPMLLRSPVAQKRTETVSTETDTDTSTKTRISRPSEGTNYLYP